MQAYYSLTVTKENVGSAIRYDEPPLLGTVIAKVTDATSGGSQKIAVLECSDSEHAQNLETDGVKELTEAEAIELAAKYRPQHTVQQLSRETGQVEEVTIPAIDLQEAVRARKARRLADAAGEAPKPAVRGSRKPPAKRARGRRARS